MKRNLTGKNIWLVGASTGIGRDLAHELACRGASLVLSARSEDKLRELADDIGPAAAVLPLDVTDTAAVEAAVASIKNLDGVVYLAAAYNPEDGREEPDVQRIRTAIDVNFTAAVCLVQAVKNRLAGRKDSFLAIYGSLAGYRGLPHGQPYSATKAALINYAESLRTELHGSVDVKIINSGFVDTRLTQQNTFKMPMLIDTATAAQKIANGLATNRFEIRFPKRFACLVQVMRILPYWVYFRIAKRIR